jgi:hypothetical protein
MINTDSLEEILSKFAGNQIDSKEFLNLILTSDETGVDYLQNLKKEFKDSYVNPVFKKVKDHYKKIDNVISDEESKKKVLSNINDPMGVIALNREYSEKAKKILDKQLDNLNLNSVSSKEKQNTALENLNLNSVSSKEKQNTALENSTVSSVIDPNNVVNKFQEQQTLTEKNPLISLSDESINKLGLVLNGLNVENLKRYGKPIKEKEESEGGGGLLSTIGSLLLAGGVGAMLLSVFWSSHIKPWLEEKVGIKLDIFDKFEGIVEGIGKFFTVGGLQLTSGWLFNLVGKAFTSFGDLLEGGLKAIFKLGFGDDVIKEGAKAAPSAFKTLLPKIAGGLFKGAGLIAMKGIPIIGSLISFYFAYDRFQKGDTISGFIDLLNGVSSLVPGYGLPLSIGLSALNAFLDYKAAGVGTTEQQQAGKLSIIGDLASGFYNFVKEIPIIGGVISSIEGFAQFAYSIATGNTGGVKDGLQKMSNFPLLGVFPSIMLSLMNASTNEKNEFTGLDINKFVSNLRKNTLKTILGWVPSWFGIRSELANFMGVELDGSDKEEDPFALTQTQAKLKNLVEGQKPIFKTGTEYTPVQNTDELKKLKAERDSIQKQLEDSTKKYTNKNTISENGTENTPEIPVHEQMKINEKLSERLKYLDEQMKTIEEYNKQNSTANKPNSKSHEDFSFKSLMTSTEGNSILYDKNTNTANVLHPDDNVLGYKTGGVFDVALKELTLLAQSINKGIYKIPESLEKNKSNASNVSVVNGSGGSGGNMLDVILSGTRPDSIYNFRRSIQGEFA